MLLNSSKWRLIGAEINTLLNKKLSVTQKSNSQNMFAIMYYFIGYLYVFNIYVHLYVFLVKIIIILKLKNKEKYKKCPSTFSLEACIYVSVFFSKNCTVCNSRTYIILISY